MLPEKSVEQFAKKILLMNTFHPYLGSSQDKMPIPSVVIEPASSNEGDDDRDGDIVSPIASSGDGVTPDSQTAKDISSSDMPPGFLYKVNK